MPPGPAPDTVPLLDAAAAAAGDRSAVDAGETWAGLMEHAAGHLARGVVGHAGRGYGLRVAVLAGKGNNGGDGWGAARRLHAAGAAAWVVAPDGLEVAMSDEAAANRRRWLAAGGRAGGAEQLEAALAWCDIAVDALLGTGVAGAPRGAAGTAAAALLRAHQRGVPVVACDVPSGVSADDGSAPDGSVVADLTVTFGGLKRGLVLHPGAAHAGRVVVAGLGPRYRSPEVTWAALTARGAAPRPLAPDADKIARGVVLVVAGSRGMAGAAALTTRGAVGAGAGLVTVATPASIWDVVAPLVPGATSIGLADGGGAVAPAAADAVAERAAGAHAVVAGPGLTPSPGTRQVVDRLRTAAPRLVLDADALNVYRDDPDALAQHAGALVLTPHERELARIGGGEDGPDAWARRAVRVPELAAELDATIVAKGPGTLVAAPDGRVWVTPTGGPGLGSGGTGDVLAGAIAAAVATAGDVPLAVARACWWHGLAGELAGRRTAGRSSSEAVAAGLPAALARSSELSASDPGWPLRPGRPVP